MYPPRPLPLFHVTFHAMLKFLCVRSNPILYLQEESGDDDEENDEDISDDEEVPTTEPKAEEKITAVTKADKERAVAELRKIFIYNVSEVIR